MNVLRISPIAFAAIFAFGCSSSSSGSTVDSGTTGDSSTTVPSDAATGDSSTSGGDTGTTGTDGATAADTGTTTTNDAGGGEASAGPMPVCTGVPATPPSMGSCVTFPGDAGLSDAGELDAGVDDGGNAATTTCNPLTNAGCTGTDVCQPDNSGANYYCQPAGSPAAIAVCGDCSAANATCGVGGVCVGTSQTAAECMQMCCTDADCGSGASCNMSFLQSPLGFNIGICTTM